MHETYKDKWMARADYIILLYSSLNVKTFTIPENSLLFFPHRSYVSEQDRRYFTRIIGFRKRWLADLIFVYLLPGVSSPLS